MALIIDRLHEIATTISEWGCTVLDTEYTSRIAPMNFRCRCSREFSTNWKNIQNQIRNRHLCCCPNCATRKWTDITVAKKLKDRPLKLVESLVNIQHPSNTKVEFQCVTCDHQWKSTIDNVINKQTGCPKCANNIPYTSDSLQCKLNRDDLTVLSISTDPVYKMGLFRCSDCDETWKANIHNVIKFRYGCPYCNSNVATPVNTADGKFHSKLEFYFWHEYHKKQIGYELIRQRRYLKTRRLTCDYVIPALHLWIEISGTIMLAQQKYSNTLTEKDNIIKQHYPTDTLVVLTTISDIDQFLQLIITT